MVIITIFINEWLAGWVALAMCRFHQRCEPREVGINSIESQSP